MPSAVSAASTQSSPDREKGSRRLWEGFHAERASKQ